MAPSASSRKANAVTDPKNVNADPTPATPTPAAKPDSQTPAPEVDKAVEAADVKALLGRHTFDGKGDNAVPPSNFRGFSSEGVEKGALKDAETIAQEILHGNWGSNAQVVVQRLTDAGYAERLDEIERTYNERKLRGAPSAF